MLKREINDIKSKIIFFIPSVVSGQANFQEGVNFFGTPVQLGNKINSKTYFFEGRVLVRGY